MPKTPRKRKKAAEAAPVEVASLGVEAVPAAEPAPQPSTAPVDACADAPADAPGFKVCKACLLKLPQRAKFCNACGEPQLPGLKRPVYLAPVPTMVVEAPPRVPAQTPVPTVPRVAPPRSIGPTVVPSLAAGRPIPASLLAPGLTPEQLQAALGPAPVFAPSPPAPQPVAPEAFTPLSEPAHAPSAEPKPNPELGADPGSELGSELGSAPKGLHTTPPPPSAQSQLQALFDVATQTRILALATSRELTRERFDRLMAGWRLKPKPRVKAVAPKAAPKDKAEKKAKDKPAKGH